MPYRFWDILTTVDFKHLNKDGVVVIMPVASTEQHGPHLPVSVDVRITEGVLREMLRILPEGIDVLVLPTMSVGKANEHIGFAGTLSLSLNTVVGLWTDIAESVIKTGFRKLMILNGHGGQSHVANIVARDLRVRHDVLVAPVNWWSVRDAARVFDADEYKYGIHGGAEETSLMMYLHPELVRDQQIENFRPTSHINREKFPRLYSQGVQYAWKAEDLNRTGAIGDASLATPKYGEEILKDAAMSLVELVQEMSRFALKNPA